MDFLDGKSVDLESLIPGISTNPNAYSRRILAHLEDTAERKEASDKTCDISALDLKIKGEPFWLTLAWLKDHVPGYLKDPKIKISKPNRKSLQQIDLLRPFYMEIAEKGLAAAYQKWCPSSPKPPPSGSVLIVGGGMSGLVAAHELKKAGYKDVQILEMSQRYGGRVKTFTMKDGFDRGLHSDGMYDNQIITMARYMLNN